MPVIHCILRYQSILTYPLFQIHLNTGWHAYILQKLLEKFLDYEQYTVLLLLTAVNNQAMSSIYLTFFPFYCMAFVTFSVDYIFVLVKLGFLHPWKNCISQIVCLTFFILFSL